MRGAFGRRVWDAILALMAVGVLLLGVVLDVHFWPGIFGTISTDSIKAHGDFLSFWHSAHAFWEGEDIYDTPAEAENRNPPLWTVLISPLGLLKPLVAYRTFFLISVILTVGYLTWMAVEVRLSPRLAVPGMLLLLISSPLLKTLALGQIYPFWPWGWWWHGSRIAGTGSFVAASPWGW